MPKMSSETRAKISAALRGKARPQWVCDKISASRTGRKASESERAALREAWTRRDSKWITPEFREKSGASRRGKQSSPEHVAKIKAALTGKKATEAAREALKLAWSRDDGTRRSKAAAVMSAVAMSLPRAEVLARALKAAQASRTVRPSSIELTVASVLTALGIIYESEAVIPGTSFVADFLIPERRLVIECDGAYWHSRPGVPEKDARKDAHLGKLGYRVLRLPEAVIKAGGAVDVLRAVGL